MQQRREYKRLDFDGNVAMKIGNGRQQLIRGYLDDLSCGGFRIYTPEAIDVNKDIEFELQTKLLEQPLAGIGKVRHVNATKKYSQPFFDVGVEFVYANKNKVKSLIIDKLGAVNRPSYFKRHQNDISLSLKIAPLIIITVWLAIEATTMLNLSANMDKTYDAKLKDALVYYLYNGN